VSDAGKAPDTGAAQRLGFVKRSVRPRLWRQVLSARKRPLNAPKPAHLSPDSQQKLRICRVYGRYWDARTSAPGPPSLIVVDGFEVGLGGYWHTDYYAMRQGRWQVVFSQATAIATG